MAQVVLITGATDGIGAALVQRYSLGATKTRLLLVGRRNPLETHLRQLSGYDYCRLDLAEYGAAEQLAEWVATLNISHINRLFLNAAGGYVGAFKEQPQKEVTRLLVLNILTPLLILRELASYLDSNTIVTVVGSTAMRLYHHSYALYAASKGALAEAIRAYAAELPAKEGHSRLSHLPQVALVHPGPTRTALHRKSGMKPRQIAKMKTSSAKMVARALQRASAGEQVIGTRNRLLWYLSKWRQFPLTIQQLFSYSGVVFGRRGKRLSVLIVGAADGIGAAMAQYYYHQGWNLLLVDRDERRLTRLVQALRALSSDSKSTNTSVATIQQIVADIRHPRTQELIIAAVRRMGRLSLFCYTAAISAVAPLLTIESHIYRSIFEINLLKPVLLLQRLLSEKLLRRESRVIWFSSLSHYTSYPGAALYSATKSGLALLAAALNGNRRQKIRYCVVFPGPVRTAHARRYSPVRGGGSALRQAMERRRMPPERVAQTVAQAAAWGAARIVPGQFNWASALLGFFLPKVSRATMRQLIFRNLKEALLPPES